MSGKREPFGNPVGEQHGWETFLIEVLREEIASREAELDALRGSLRFQVGNWALEAFPPGRGTIIFFARLLRLFLKRRSRQPSGANSSKDLGLSEEMLSAHTVVFGSNVPPSLEKGNVWRTENANLVAHRLDMKGGEPGLLVVRALSEKILRRLERARHDRWRVVWFPDDESSSLDPALLAYMRAHADDVQDME